MNLFFLGAGNATEIIIDEMKGSIDKLYFYDVEESRIEYIKQKYSNAEYTDISLINKLDVDYVVECATVEAVKEHYEKIIINNLNFVVLSTGAFADDEFRNNLEEMLKTSKSMVYVPSGAVGATDLIASLGDKLESVTLTTRKPPVSLGMNDIKEEKVLFEGSSKEAIKEFPKNVNVAVTLSLAAKDFDKVSVRIVADPEVNANIHTVDITSTAGKYRLVLENYPSKNPKTSYLAPLSVAGLLRKLNDKIKVGV